MTSSSIKSPSIGLGYGSGSLWNMTHHLPVTTFIGAGGKTTCLQSLTREIKSADQQVVATTTTKVYPEGQMTPWRNLNSPPQQKGAWFWYDNVETESGKWIGPSVTVIDEAIAEDLGKRYWVVEGDGARGHKLKCWDFYEPQIPTLTDCAVLVLDRGLWGNVLQIDQVHRAHCCYDLIGEVWKAESAWSYFLKSPVFKPEYGQMSWVILLNSPRNTTENNHVIDPIKSLDLLHDFKCLMIQQNPAIFEIKPRHLRLAAGDAKEGDLLWFDLW